VSAPEGVHSPRDERPIHLPKEGGVHRVSSGARPEDLLSPTHRTTEGDSEQDQANQRGGCYCRAHNLHVRRSLVSGEQRRRP